MKKLLISSSLFLLSVTCTDTSFALQGGGRESATPPKTKAAPTRNPKSKTTPPSPRVERAESGGELMINASPPGSTVLLDGQVRGTTDGAGVLRLRLVAPGTHTLVLRKTNYFEQQLTVNVVAGANAPLKIALRSLPGSLTVTTPGVADANISIKNLHDYTGRIENLSVPQGLYDVVISKFGYRTTTRQIEIRPNTPTRLEVPLEPVPVADLITQAEAAHRENNREEVIKICRHILSTQPNEPRANYLLGLTYYNAGNAEAATYLTRAIQLGEQVALPVKYHLGKGSRYDLQTGQLIWRQDRAEFRASDGQTLTITGGNIAGLKVAPGEKGGRLEVKLSLPKGKRDDYHFHPAQANPTPGPRPSINCDNCLPVLTILNTLFEQLRAGVPSATTR